MGSNAIAQLNAVQSWYYGHDYHCHGGSVMMAVVPTTASIPHQLWPSIALQLQTFKLYIQCIIILVAAARICCVGTHGE